jgi:hypothetical protein
VELAQIAHANDCGGNSFRRLHDYAILGRNPDHCDAAGIRFSEQ